MKKEVLIFGIVSLIVLGVLVSAYGYDQNNNEIRLRIEKGWNLIPTSSSELQKGESFIKWSDLKYGFVYDRQNNKYILAMQDGKDLTSGKPPASFTANWLMTSSIWVYSEKEGDFVIKWDPNIDGQKTSDYELIKGWNFVWINPEFTDNSLNDMKGNCDLNKIYLWDASSQEWSTEGESQEIALQAKFSQNVVGQGMVVKVSNDCNFGSSNEGITNPPQLPEGSSAKGDYIVERDIGEAVFRSSNSDTQQCILSNNSCSRYEGDYRYNSKSIGVVVEIDNNISTDNFVQKFEAKLGTCGKGDFVGEDYCVAHVGNDIVIVWKSNNKIIALEYEPGSDTNADILEDILSVYLPKYPSDLNWN